MIFKKLILLTLIASLICMSTVAYASFQDISPISTYSDAVIRLTNLGIFSNTDTKFNPNDLVTREQFAQIIITAAGLEDTAGAMKGTTIYSDVKSSSSYSGYINAAVSKGYLSGMADGKFHPTDKITFAQVCTFLVKALGYSDQDVNGLWPKNYIDKARNLNLLDGINLKNNDSLPKWTIAILIDKLLDTNIKKNNSSEADKTFAVASGMTNDNIYTVYSKPETVRNFNKTTQKIGSIDLSGNPSIIRNTIDISETPATNIIGQSIDISKIKENDIVYQVSDKSGKNRYILVIDNKVEGTITSILPNKITPKTVQIDNKNYDLSKYSNLSKLNNTPGAYNVEDSVKVLLGYDGKIVDIVSNTDADNANYALVLNNYSKTSSAIEDNGSIIYYVKLLHTDGSTKTYIINNLGYTGELIKFKITAEANTDGIETVELEKMASVDVKEYNIDKEKRKVNSSYIADDIKIFNLVFKIYGTDCDARLMNWSDLPNGTIPAGKIKYFAKVGAFNDINIMFVDNILDENYSLGVLTKTSQKSSAQLGTTYTNTILINGKEYTTSSNIAGIGVNSVVKVIMRNGSILSIEQVVSQWVETSTVDAIDSKRIMINGNIYDLGSDVAIYLRDYDGKYIVKGTNDIVPGQKYSRVSVYVDKNPSNNGKAKIIIYS